MNRSLLGLGPCAPQARGNRRPRGGGPARCKPTDRKLVLRNWLFVTVIGFLAACGNEGAPKFEGPPPDAAAAFGSCVFCHASETSNLLTISTEVKCEVCHADVLVGRVGPGHREIPGPDTVPSFVDPSHSTGPEAVFSPCVLCHSDLATTLTPLGDQLSCQTCHADQQPGMFGPGHRRLPGPEQVPAFPGPAHDTGAQGVFGE